MFTFMFLTTVGFSQTDSIRGPQFELTGNIINEIPRTPHCGYSGFGTVIKFELIELSDSNYKLDSIGLVFTCPEFYKDDFFEVGETYTAFFLFRLSKLFV